MPIIDFLLHHVLGMTVTLLDLAFELLALAVYRGKVVVSELGLFFLDLANELLPVTFDTIPIHETLLPVGLQVVTEGGPLHTGCTHSSHLRQAAHYLSSFQSSAEITALRT